LLLILIYFTVLHIAARFKIIVQKESS